MSAVTARTCPHCNKSVDTDSKFCQHCASAIPAYVPKPEKIPSGEETESVKKKQVSSLKSRYVDGYRKARVIDGLGTTIKAIGIIVGIIVAMVMFYISSEALRGSAAFVGVVFGIFLGAIILGVCFIGGVIISAHGQMLKASLDSAVNSSPMLTNEDRAVIMSLPQS